MLNNSVHLIGTLTKDLELSENDNGNAFVHFTLSCERDGISSYHDFVGCVAFGDIAKEICKNGKEGYKYAIDGYIRTSSYKKNGKKTYVTNVVTESFDFLYD